MAALPSTFGPWRLCVAPMMGHTDRHFRYLLRLLAPHARLYTEMVTANAIVHHAKRGSEARLLARSDAERPLALQVGGSEPEALAKCACIAEALAYDEINLNVGCPSPRVISGAFGACLMREPKLVAECVAAMRAATTLPVTVKCRLGVDDEDQPEFLEAFATEQFAAGASALLVHARVARLDGLSPEENREIPPLMPHRVHALKAAHPDWTIVLNGGITTSTQVAEHLQFVDGAMLGRAIVARPPLLAELEQCLFGTSLINAGDVLARYVAYAEEQLMRGEAAPRMLRRTLNLFSGVPGSRAYRRTITEGLQRGEDGLRLLRRAATLVAAA